MQKALIVILTVITLVRGRIINKAGLNLIKEFEGFRADFYGDATGIKTIGYGHACFTAAQCSQIHPPITEAQGEKLLQEDLVRFESCVEGKAPGLPDNKFAALVSFVYNLGCGNLSDTLLADVRAKKWVAAANQMTQYVRAGGKVLPGLVRRRNAEKALFLS